MINYIDDIAVYSEPERVKRSKDKRLDKQGRKAESAYRKSRKNRRVI